MESKEAPKQFWLKWSGIAFWLASSAILFNLRRVVQSLPAEIQPIATFIVFVISTCVGGWLLWRGVKKRDMEDGMTGGFLLAVGVIGSLWSMNFGNDMWGQVFLVVVLIYGLAYVARLIVMIAPRWRK